MKITPHLTNQPFSPHRVALGTYEKPAHGLSHDQKMTIIKKASSVLSQKKK